MFQAAHAFDVSIPPPVWIETEHQARQLIDYYLQSHRRNGGLGLDTETTGLDRIRDLVVIWSISDGETRYCLDSKFLPLFKEPILENPDINFDLTNARFDMHMLANMGIDLTKAGECRCTIVQSWLKNENNQGRHGLKERVVDVFGRTTPTFEQTFGKIPPRKIDKVTGRNIAKTIGQIIREAIADPERHSYAVDYASLDAYNSTMLRQAQDDLLDVENIGWGTLKDYYYRVEVPFTKVLFKMERRGITVDAGYLQELHEPMLQRMEEIRGRFVREAGSLINLNSPIQLRQFFFEKLQKESIKKTKGGKSGIKQDALDNEVLEEWAGQGCPWSQALLEYRSVAKIEGTYVSGLQQWIDREYRIHTSLNQTGTVTGRLSSSEPNLQNLPRAGEDEFKIREAFIAAAHGKLLVADYEQLEMRLMAHFSGDERMIDAIQKGMDLHCYTTSEMEGIPYDDVVAAKKAKEPNARQLELLLKRQNNKSTGFGIIYGIGGPKLARKLTRETKHLVTDEEGKALIDKWLNVFPGVRSYITDTKQRIRQMGYVEVITGRRRRFGDVARMSRNDAAQADRQAVNSVIQGTAAEAAKFAMIACEHDPELNRLGAKLLLQIHDELIFDIPDDPEIGETVKKRVKEIMEHPFSTELRVPLPASAGIAESWAAAK